MARRAVFMNGDCTAKYLQNQIDRNMYTTIAAIRGEASGGGKGKGVWDQRE